MYYETVPQTLEQNIAYRLEIREKAVCDAGFRRALIQACREDVLFFFSAFCWLFEPRPRRDGNGKMLPKMIPFIPWEHQIDPIQRMREALGFRDIIAYKSRGEGLSWIAILLALHDWLFDDMAKVGLVSKDEDTADDPNNMDSLGAKLDWELSCLPTWMVGRGGFGAEFDWSRNRAEHSWVNHRTRSQINAFACGPNVGRAGRYKWFLADELGMWPPGKDDEFVEGIGDSTDSLLAISTPSPRGCGAFHEMVHSPSPDAVKIRIHWSDNPYKNRGLYRMVRNNPSSVDPFLNPMPSDYRPPSNEVLRRFAILRQRGFNLEGGVRSPWYDKQCARPKKTPQSIARELDIDFGGALYRVFTQQFFDTAAKTIRPPVRRGDISYHPETLELEWNDDPNGPMKLWCQLDSSHRPPRRRYAVAADVGSGLGGSHTSNSVLQILDVQNMEQVGQIAANTVEASEFGELGVVLAKWFWNAYLGWEINGPGAAFSKRVLELGYADLYMRKVFHKKSRKFSRDVGWHTNPGSKEVMFADMLRMVKNGDFTIRDEDMLNECREYVRTGPMAKIEHVLSVQSGVDAGPSHGDRVIAMCVGLQMAKERFSSDSFSAEPPEPVGEPPPDTMAWRVAQWDREESEAAAVWDTLTIADLMGRRL